MNHPPDTRVLIHRGTGTCYRKPDLHICKFDFKNADFLHIRWMDVIILTFSMPQFPDHGLGLVERQTTLSKAG